MAERKCLLFVARTLICLYHVLTPCSVDYVPIYVKALITIHSNILGSYLVPVIDLRQTSVENHVLFNYVEPNIES